MAHFFSFKTAKISWLKPRLFLVLVILLAAGFLRLYRIADYMTFLGDEGRDVLVVYNILHGKLTLLGPTASVGGFFLGPIYYYLMAPFLFISNYNPVGPAVMVALFGIATVYLVYKVGAEFFGWKAGLFASSLYAISPLVIAYSRSSWNPNLIPFFSLLTLYVLYKAVVGKQKMRLFAASGFLLGIAMQLHYLATFLGVVMFFYVLLTSFITASLKTSVQAEDEGEERFQDSASVNSEAVESLPDRKAQILSPRKLIIKSEQTIRGILIKYIAIFTGFVIGLSPFLAFEIRHNFPNIQSIIRFVFFSEDTGSSEQVSSIMHNVFFRLFGRLLTHFPPPEQVNWHENLDIALWRNLTLFLAYFSLFALIFPLFRKIQQRNETVQRLLLICWFAIGVSLFGFYKKQIYDYYLGFLFPLPFLLVGNLLSVLSSSVFRIKNIGWLAAMVFGLLVFMNLQGLPFRHIPNRQLAQVEKISNFVLSKTEGKPFNFALITLGNSDHGYRYFFQLKKMPPVRIEPLHADPDRKTVTDQLLIVCEDPNCKPLGHPLWEVAGFGRAQVIGEWQVSVVKVYKLVHYKDK